MSLFSENVIPGNHGKIFTVNIEDQKEFEKIQEALLKLDGIKDVMFTNEEHPPEITVHTDKLVKVEDVQSVIKEQGFHAVPKSLFGLEE